MTMSRAIPFPTVAAPTVVNLKPHLFHGPTLRKCPHGQYLGALDGDTSPYCRLCGGDGEPADARPVVLPRSSGDPLSNTGRMMANKRSGTGCPECGSAIYLRVNEKNASRRECADCGARYTARLSDHQRALLVQQEADYE